MKHTILLFGFAAALLTGCSTYRAGQTPDDVYYSPAREAVAKTETKRTDRYDDYATREDDQYLRMKIRNRDRWSLIDDNDYWYDSRYVPLYDYNTYRNNWNSYTWNNWNPGYYNTLSPYTVFGYGRNYGYGNYYGYGYGGSYYPGGYFKGQTYITKRPPSVSRPTLSGYSNRNYNNNNYNLGNTILKAISPSSSNANNSYSNTNSNNNNTYTAPERTYTPSSSGSSSSSSSSSSGSSGGVSRPARNGN